MTICIAALCDKSKAVVLASDRMITNNYLSIQFEHDEKKMTQLSNTCVALTAGDALSYTELFNFARTHLDRLKTPPIQNIVDLIKDCYQEVRLSEIEDNILKRRGFVNWKDFCNKQGVVLDGIIFNTRTNR